MNENVRRVYSVRRFKIVVALLTAIFLPIVVGTSLLIYQYLRFSVMVQQRLSGEKGRLPARVYRECVLYTTLSPCAMCSGAILLYGIPRVVIGENQTFMGEEDLLRSRGVSVEVVQDPRCVAMMRAFIAAHPELWNEDIGV